MIGTFVGASSGALVRQVQIPQQTTLGCQAMHAGKKPLQPFEVVVAFHYDQFVLPFLPSLMPLFCDLGRTFRRVGNTDLPKPCSLNESLILSRRTVHVKANRTTCGDFLVRKHSANYQRVTK